MQWLCETLHFCYTKINVNIAIFQTKKIKSDSIQPRPEHHIFFACVHSHSIQGFHSLPASEASVNVIVFSSQHGRHPRTVSLSGCMTKQSRWWYVDQSNPDFTHISDDITRRKDYFFFFLKTVPKIPVWPPWWIFIGYWSAEDSTILTRCEGHDLQIFGLKRGWGLLPWTVRSSVTTWLAVQPLERKKKEK